MRPFKVAPDARGVGVQPTWRRLEQTHAVADNARSAFHGPPPGSRIDVEFHRVDLLTNAGLCAVCVQVSDPAVRAHQRTVVVQCRQNPAATEDLYLLALRNRPGAERHLTQCPSSKSGSVSRCSLGFGDESLHRRLTPLHDLCEQRTDVVQICHMQNGIDHASRERCDGTSVRKPTPRRTCGPLHTNKANVTHLTRCRGNVYMSALWSLAHAIVPASRRPRDEGTFARVQHAGVHALLLGWLPGECAVDRGQENLPGSAMLDAAIHRALAEVVQRLRPGDDALLPAEKVIKRVGGLHARQGDPGALSWASDRTSCVDTVGRSTGKIEVTPPPEIGGWLHFDHQPRRVRGLRG